MVSHRREVKLNRLGWSTGIGRAVDALDNVALVVEDFNNKLMPVGMSPGVHAVGVARANSGVDPALDSIALTRYVVGVDRSNR